MKQLFIALVVLNICYLLFQQMTTAEAVVPEPVPGVSPALLTHTEARTQTAVAPVQPAEDDLASAPQTLLEPVPESTAQVALAQDATTPVPARPVAAADSADDANPAGAEKAPGTPRATAAEPGPQSVAARPVASCVIAGPFRARRDGQALVKQLANAGIDAELQPRDTSLLPDYMVYVGPQNSQAEARALEATFTARKMDSHVIAGGALENALSLGVFSRGPLAKSLREQLRKEGYNARISELTRNRRGYQVRTRLPQLIRARLIEADTPMVDCPQAIAQR